MTYKPKDCPIRHENGNCLVVGGFCPAVNVYMCEVVRNAYDSGRLSALREQEEREKKPLSAFLEPMDRYKGLKRKFLVFKSDTGEMVENCFVLCPDKDHAAVEALRAYAEATNNDTLSVDIINWVGAEEERENHMPPLYAGGLG